MIDANPTWTEVFAGLRPMQAWGGERPAIASRETRRAAGAAG